MSITSSGQLLMIFLNVPSMVQAHLHLESSVKWLVEHGSWHLKHIGSSKPWCLSRYSKCNQLLLLDIDCLSIHAVDCKLQRLFQWDHLMARLLWRGNVPAHFTAQYDRLCQLSQGTYGAQQRTGYHSNQQPLISKSRRLRINCFKHSV